MHVPAVVHIQHGCNVNLHSLFELVKSFPALLSKIHCCVFINQNVQAPYWRQSNVNDIPSLWSRRLKKGWGLLSDDSRSASERASTDMKICTNHPLGSVDNPLTRCTWKLNSMACMWVFGWSIIVITSTMIFTVCPQTNIVMTAVLLTIINNVQSLPNYWKLT